MAAIVSSCIEERAIGRTGEPVHVFIIPLVVGPRNKRVQCLNWSMQKNTPRLRGAAYGSVYALKRKTRLK